MLTNPDIQIKQTELDLRKFYNHFFILQQQIDSRDANTEDPQNFLDVFKREILKNQDDPKTPFTSMSDNR